MDVEGPGPQSATFRLVYRSRDRIPLDRRRTGLGEVFAQARSNNKERDITGALLVSDDCFVQTLEGEETAVRALYARICQDPRHEDVELLEAHDVPARVFSRWAMAKIADDGEPDIPLLKNKAGITPAAPRPSTPEQDALLQVMRDAVR